VGLVALGNTHPYLSVGVQGDAGKGKSHLGGELVAGLALLLRERGLLTPGAHVTIADTESRAHLRRAQLFAAGVGALAEPVRTLADWCALVDAVAAGRGGAAPILLTDSVTHLWEDLVTAYLEARGIAELAPSDWVAVKAIWHREFSRRIREAPVHHVFTVRDGDRYVGVVGADGKADAVPLGRKARAEAELAFEPLVMLEAIGFDVDLGAHTVRVLKDATGVHREGAIVDAAWPPFAACAEAQLVGVVEPREIVSRPTSTLFGSGAVLVSREARGLAEGLRGVLSAAGLSHQQRARILQRVVGTTSWTAIERLEAETLRRAIADARAMTASPGAIAIATAMPTTPAPHKVIARVREALRDMPADETLREATLAAAQAAVEQLPNPERGEGLGVVAAARKRWETAAYDQRTDVAFGGDDLPY
jgi:hypothetical protein